MSMSFTRYFMSAYQRTSAFRAFPRFSASAFRAATSLLTALMICLSVLVGGPLQAAPFTAGDIVVDRVGNGTTALGSAAFAVSLVELTTSGSNPPAGANIIAIPNSTTANNTGGVTDSGSATSNGFMNRSADASLLSLIGYDAAVGTASVNGATGIDRTAAKIDTSGAVTVVARLSDAFPANNARASVTDSGVTYYAAGAGSSTFGVRYFDTTSGVPTTSVGIHPSATVRDIVIATDGSGNKFLLDSTQTAILAFSGFPTTSSTPTALSLSTALIDAGAFILLDRKSGVGATGLGGLDTLYVADGSSTGSTGTAIIRKYEWNGTQWAAMGTATLSTSGSKLFGLTGQIVANGSVELYATTQIGSNNSVVKVIDTSNSNAFGGNLTGTLSVIASAGTNFAFRGITLAPVSRPDLVVSVSAPVNGSVGSNYNYTITATNNGSADATGVSVQFTMPAGLNYVSASGTNGFSGSNSSGVVTFTGGSITAGTSATLTVTVNPPTAATYTAPAGAAVIDPSNTIAETNELNNSSPDAAGTIVANTPDLMVDISGPAQAVKDTPFNYTITAQNSGVADASGVSVQFTLPLGVSFSSGSGDGFTVNEASGVVTFSGGSISVGGSAVLTVSATASPAAPASCIVPAGAVIIDPANTISESNESNNASVSTVSTFVRLFPLPAAMDDSYTLGANSSLSVDAADGLLANDAGGALGFIVTSNPSHGTVTINADGSFVYIPNTGYTGADTFTYTVSDAVKLYKSNAPSLGTFGGVNISGGGFGSAIYPVPGTTDEYYGITDRGPNVDGPGGSKIAPIPNFAPSIARFKLINGVAALQGSPIPMKASDGTPYNGLANSANSGEAFLDLNGNALPSSALGYDSEGLVALPDGTFWISDEYGPFLTHFDATVTQIGRLSPFDGSLPVELAHRMDNRGMEGLTVTPDGSTLVGIMQSALDQLDNSSADPTRIAPLRIVTYNLLSQELHEYLYMLESPNSGNKVSVSEITALSNTTFAVDERDNKFPPTAQKKLYTIDISGATDVGPASTVAGAVYESTGDQRGLTISGHSLEKLVGEVDTPTATSTLASHGITPVSKSLYLDLSGTLNALSPSGTFFSHDKIEGVAISGNTVVVSNDSDFGIDGVNESAPPFTLHVKVSPATPAVQEDGEILVIDTTRLPAATSTATVTLNITPAPNPVVYDGVTIASPSVDDGQVAPIDFGTINVMASGSRTFTIQNNGTIDLTGLSISFDGPNAEDFSLASSPVAPVSPGGVTNFAVQFSPGSPGMSTAALHISSNALGAKASYDINLTGVGNAAPVLTLPDHTFAEATSPAGAAVTFDVTANDPEDGSLTPVVDPASGSTFALGDTIVHVSATDSQNNTTSGTFIVTVQDHTAPSIAAPPGGFTPLALSAGESLPDYTVQAVTSDAVGVVSITQSPVAGTVQMLGTTTVTLTAFDAAGNHSSTQFDVTVNAAPVTSSIIASKGGDVPGASADARIGTGAIWKSFGIPAINENGQTAVVGNWAVKTKAGSGIFVGNPLALLIAKGEAAPGISGTLFSTFTDPVIDHGSSGNSSVAFSAKVGLPLHATTPVLSSKNNLGIWTNAGGSLTLVARLGDDAPGTGGGVFKKFNSYSLIENEVIVVASLVAPTTTAPSAPGGVTKLDDVGVWRWTASGGLQLLLREGQTVPTDAGDKIVSVFQMLGTVSGSPGHGRHHLAAGLYEVRVVCVDKTVVDYLIDATGASPVFQQLTRTGAAVIPGLTATTLGVPSGNGTKETAFLESFKTAKGGPTSADNTAVIANRGSAWELVARRGASAGSTVKWATFKDPVLNESGDVAWIGTLGGTATTADKTIIAWSPLGGTAGVVARQGSAAPETDGAVFNSFTALALPDGGLGPIFTATLLAKTAGVPPGPGNVTKTNDTGLWGVDRSGNVRLLLREGQTIAGKTVASFKVIGNVVGSPGETRSFNAQRQAVVRVSFTDLSQLLETITVP